MLLPNIHLYNFNLYFSLVQGRAALQACKGEWLCDSDTLLISQISPIISDNIAACKFPISSFLKCILNNKNCKA